MLKKKYRLKKETAFSATYRLKNCKSNGVLTIYKGKAKTAEKIPTKLGIVVSKKIHKRAVRRNRIKRRLREIYIDAVKNHLVDNTQDALSIIFIAKYRCLDISYQELSASVIKLLQEF